MRTYNEKRDRLIVLKNKAHLEDGDAKEAALLIQELYLDHDKALDNIGKELASINPSSKRFPTVFSNN